MNARICNNCGMQVSETARFCTGCGTEVQHEPSQPILPKQSPSVIKSAKKGFGVGTKIGLGTGLIFFLIIAVGVINGSNNTEPSSSNTMTPDQQAVDFVQNYKGPNNDGYSIVQIIVFIVDAAYPSENILNNPSTEHGWFATRDYNQEGNIWKVEFDFKTYRENIGIVFYTNMDSHTIYAGDIVAKNILDIVNMPSNSVSNSTLSNIHLT